MARITRYALAGLLGILIAWIILEPTPLMPNDKHQISALQTTIVGLLLGGFLGFGVGLAGALGGVSSRNGVKTIVGGTIVGGIGGIVGLTLGNIIWAQFESLDGSDVTALSFVMLMLGRGIGWALIGLFVGLSQGIALMSERKIKSGLIGGIIGGGLGGMVFQLLGFFGFQPWILRMLGFSILGFTVGLFIGIIDEIAKKAWLIKDLGRGEGKEFHLFQKTTMLGRSELVDVPVYGDPMVAQQHAKIELENDRYVIYDLGSSTGTTVNGTRIQSQPLKDGDIIHLGTSKFIFKTKGSRKADAYVPAYVPPTATDGLICPFCGEFKDANGNCSCSVTAPPPAQPQQAPMQYQQPTQMIQTPSMPTQMIQPENPAMVSLVGISGPYSGTTHTVVSGFTIGREPAREIALPNDATISRNHARIFMEPSGWIIEDSGSANGTFVNEQRITRRELIDKDIIRIGNSSFRFEITK